MMDPSSDPRSLLRTAPGLFAIALLLVASSGLAQRGKGLFQVMARDAQTHFAVQADVRFEGPETRTVKTNAKGRVAALLDPGEYQLEVSALGYKLMRTHSRVSVGRHRMSIMLDAENPPAQERPDVIKSETRPGYTLLHGYVVDGEAGKPIAGVEVRVLRGRVRTSTDAAGHYLLLLHTPEPEFPGGMGMDTLVFEKAGYKQIIFRNFAIGGEAMGGEGLELEKGSGVISLNATHKLLRK